MPKYTYQAINESGNTVSGDLEADSLDMANSILTSRGYIPSKVTETGQVVSPAFLRWLKEQFTYIKTPELILFTKQFKTLIKAGVPILRLLKVLENQTENAALKEITFTVTQDIEEGASLYDAFRKHPKAFSPLYCSMLRAGEASGSLPDIMERLIYIMEHEHKVRSDIRSALSYPAVVLGFLGVAFFILLTFVVPKFASTFAKTDVPLPIPTQICIGLYEFVANYWLVITLALIGTVVFLNYFLRTERGKLAKDTLLMSIPVIGPLFNKAAMSRFASIFSILHASGVAVLDCIRILTGTIGNQAIANEFDLISERLEEGRGLAEPLKSAQYFPPIVINMIAIGEESDNLEEMLNEIALHYDAELEYAMKKLSDLIGPVLTLGLAVVVGFFALAIYLPMWNMSQMVK
ncbi:MAG: type II secretion system F family protein [Deltaproteobacteria bacterium]|nr:type II secretion system F family protein [Deltaproteobacteria bacterium]